MTKVSVLEQVDNLTVFNLCIICFLLSIVSLLSFFWIETFIIEHSSIPASHLIEHGSIPASHLIELNSDNRCSIVRY